MIYRVKWRLSWQFMNRPDEEIHADFTDGSDAFIFAAGLKSRGIDFTPEVLEGGS